MNGSMDPAMDKLHITGRKDNGKFSAAEWLLLATAGLAFSAVVGIVGYSALLV
ncbi:MAG: hypothetical protein ACR2P1_28900 [Pseudomonadales bacterium]